MACYIPRWYTRPKTVTHPGSNRARRALTSFMRRTPLTTTPRRQPGGTNVLRSKHACAIRRARRYVCAYTQCYVVLCDQDTRLIRCMHMSHARHASAAEQYSGMNLDSISACILDRNCSQRDLSAMILTNSTLGSCKSADLSSSRRWTEAQYRLTVS